MLHSLFTHNKEESFDIHFLHRPTLDNEYLKRLEFLCTRYGAKWHSYPIPSEMLSHFPTSDNYPEEAWYRLLLPALLEGLDRVLWLDSDVLVLQSIGDLWETDLEGCPLAAATNVLPSYHWHLPPKLGIRDRRLYFNTGVLIMDLDQLRKENAVEECSRCVEKYRDVIHHADQDVLNALYYGRRKKIPLRWNVIVTTFYLRPECLRLHGADEYHEALRQPGIIHFTGGKRFKPWSYSSPHPYRDKYLEHRQAADWDLPAYDERHLRDGFVRRLPLRYLVLFSMLRRLRIRDFLATL